MMQAHTGASALPLAPPYNADDPPMLVPGAVVAGRYRVLVPVGAGKHGTVSRALDERTGQMVAVKCLWREQGQREAKLLGRLTHPMLPALLEVIADDLATCLVMEFIAGEPLRQWSADAEGERRLLPLAEVFRIGFHLCEVFAYLHSVEPPILFQDLHSSNVLRLADGRIKLIDFGRARPLSPAEVAEKRPFDISDIRHLLASLLPPGFPREDFWRVRGVHPSLHPEDAGKLRTALAALKREFSPSEEG